MNKEKWKKRTGQLRKLLRMIVPSAQPRSGHGRLMIGYFGAYWHPQSSQWYIYNARTSNVIASIRFTREDPPIGVIRYRASSVYSPILKTFTFPMETKHAISTTLGRRATTVTAEMHERILVNAARERRAARVEVARANTRVESSLNEMVNAFYEQANPTRLSARLTMAQYARMMENTGEIRIPRPSTTRLRDEYGRFIRREAAGLYGQSPTTSTLRAGDTVETVDIQRLMRRSPGFTASFQDGVLRQVTDGTEVSDPEIDVQF